ncbi:MAG TPA: zinc ribbon domain-containing protein, partial [Polyangiaceae bacterium LLY-WYZ-15_(1-7)]|nr:zinc ribbon domain-containing protein [Polyangiaceae bacterium LLY-WYZ-15_(1-7)]
MSGWEREASGTARMGASAWDDDRTKPGCGRCGSPLEPEDLRCAVCFLPVPAGQGGAARAVARILRCDGCGAALTYDVKVQAPKCAFCGSVARLEETEDPIEEADAYLPFRVDPATARQAVKSWLGSLGWFRPADLATEATVAELTPLWFVAWTFDVEALVSWAADSNAGAGRAAWAPHSGQVPMTVQAALVSASRGLEEEEVAKLAPHFDLSSAQEAPHEMEGAAIERFAVPRSAARRIIERAVMAQARSHAKQFIPGSRVRKLSAAVLPRRLRTRRYGFPSYVLAYRYREKLYRAIVHGQDARVAFGKAPWSVWKILLAVLGGVAGVAAIAG